MTQTFNCKVVIIGDSCTGKSSIAIRYVNNKFINLQENTIGAAFLQKDIFTNWGKITYEIWDTAGQERYKSLTPMYYRNAKVAIIVFDLTNETSFYNSLNWIKEINEKCDDIITVLVGNKCDLDNQINKELIQETIKSYNISYYETSAKENYNISNLFNDISLNFKKINNNYSPVEIKSNNNDYYKKINNCC